jgi:hypothetical protein
MAGSALHIGDQGEQGRYYLLLTEIHRLFSHELLGFSIATKYQ